MSITLCMIVKNEEKYIKMCLDNAISIVDEIIILDTGSTDKTKDIIKDYGDKIRLIESPWKNDFSEARNKSIEQAKGDWILVLDADEKIIFNRNALINILENTQHEGFKIPIYSISDSVTITYSCLYCKIFRNKGYRYSGEVHENIQIDYSKIIDLSPDVCKVIHYGYTQENVDSKDKINRNLNILKKQLIKSPNDPFVNYNIGNTYLSQGKYNKALDHYIKCHSITKKIYPSYKPIMLFNIAQCLFQLKEYTNCINFLNQLVPNYNDGNKTDLLYTLGYCYYEIKKYDLAIDTFKKCIDIGEIRTDISSLGKGSYMPKILLARIYAENDDINKAAMQYIEALFDKNNFLRNGKEEVIDFLKRNELVEILDELNSFLKNM